MKPSVVNLMSRKLLNKQPYIYVVLNKLVSAKVKHNTFRASSEANSRAVISLSCHNTTSFHLTGVV